jgi:hypothetical protein
MTKVTYICRSPGKKHSLTHFILILFLSIFCKLHFWAFRNKGSSKTRQKKHLGASQKMWGFFIAFFGRFVTRPFQKNRKIISAAAKKSTHTHYSLAYAISFLPPPSPKPPWCPMVGSGIWLQLQAA